MAIGRNEGERLRRCLSALTEQVEAVVYVDSNSSDGSVGLARALGADVVELDMSVPFTAARARNAGYGRLRETNPGIEHVQFVDGDCELVEGWIAAASEQMDLNADRAVVTGRRIERHPETSVYNRLCDLEWRYNSGYGEVPAFGGDALVRVAAFDDVGGLDESLIAGEEPEFCFRLRQKGWKIYRLDRDMTRHDAAMTRFSQWWKRMVRSGHAYAESAWLHGRSAERYGVRETLSSWIWAVAIPAAAVGAAWITGGWSLIILAGYPISLYRTAAYYRGRGMQWNHALLYALNCVGGKFPSLQGQLKFFAAKVRGRKNPLIEYK